MAIRCNYFEPTTPHAALKRSSTALFNTASTVLFKADEARKATFSSVARWSQGSNENKTESDVLRIQNCLSRLAAGVKINRKQECLSQLAAGFKANAKTGLSLMFPELRADVFFGA